MQAALAHDVCSIEDFKALLSPAAQPFLEQMAEKAAVERRNHFGNTCISFYTACILPITVKTIVFTVVLTAITIFNRKKLNMQEIEHEMKVIADCRY